MKIKALFIIMLGMSFFISVMGQSADNIGYPRIGQNAPSFTANSTKGKIHFPQDFSGKWKILFSHPADFTPVCTSEIIELANINDELQKLNTDVLVLSTDGLNSHNEWKNSIEKMWYKNKLPVKINFPLISDQDLIVSKMYGMIRLPETDRRDIRGVFIIDPKDKIRIMFFYPDNVGRDMQEIKRTLIALQKTDSESVLTPANWKPGEDYLLHAPRSIEDATQMALEGDPKRYNYDWYMWFQKDNLKD
ncbi:MAG: peroxiredoxin [Bacteroidales bacterium]